MMKIYSMPIMSYAAALFFGVLITSFSSVGIFVIILLMLAIRFSPNRTLYSVYEQLSTSIFILSLVLAFLVNLRCEDIVCFFVNSLGVFVIFISFFSMRNRVYKTMGATDQIDDKLGVKDVWQKSKSKTSDLFARSKKQ